MQINKIKKLGTSYQIEFTNGTKIKTYDDVILKNNLLYKKEINEEEYASLLKDNSFGYIYNKVLRYISVRLRSKMEVKEYLNKIEASDKEKVLALLIKNGFIDDKRFALAYAKDAFYLTNDGPYKIKSNLLEKGIDDYLASSSIAFEHEEIIDKLDKLINKRIKISKPYSEYVLKQKLIVYFINLGYAKEDINLLLEKITFNNDNPEKDYDKIKNKLIKKYSDRELYFKIKQKLCQKGYNSYDIEALINKDF